jgi:hypothetical protein
MPSPLMVLAPHKTSYWRFRVTVSHQGLFERGERQTTTSSSSSLICKDSYSMLNIVFSLWSIQQQSLQLSHDAIFEIWWRSFSILLNKLCYFSHNTHSFLFFDHLLMNSYVSFQIPQALSNGNIHRFHSSSLWVNRSPHIDTGQSQTKQRTI